VGLVDRLQAGDPAQIGPFRLLGRLGEGGMGRVFLGESPGGRMVAVKVVHPDYVSDPGFRSRFAREVAAARQVGGFHTAAVVGGDPGADPPWMATAYIPGPSLAEAVAGDLDRTVVIVGAHQLPRRRSGETTDRVALRNLQPDSFGAAPDTPLRSPEIQTCPQGVRHPVCQRSVPVHGI
jgi:hypothetical protein